MSICTTAEPGLGAPKTYAVIINQNLHLKHPADRCLPDVDYVSLPSSHTRIDFKTFSCVVHADVHRLTCTV